MPTHPENTEPDETNDETDNWTPEKEKRRDPDEMMERALKMLEKQFGRMIGPQFQPMSIGPPVHEPTITIKAIDNGFMVFCGPLIVKGAIVNREVFATDFSDAELTLREFMRILEKIKIEQIKKTSSGPE